MMDSEPITTNTDAHGAFVIANLPAGAVLVWVLRTFPSSDDPVNVHIGEGPGVRVQLATELDGLRTWSWPWRPPKVRFLSLGRVRPTIHLAEPLPRGGVERSAGSVDCTLEEACLAKRRKLAEGRDLRGFATSVLSVRTRRSGTASRTPGVATDTEPDGVSDSRCSLVSSRGG